MWTESQDLPRAHADMSDSDLRHGWTQGEGGVPVSARAGFLRGAMAWGPNFLLAEPHIGMAVDKLFTLHDTYRTNSTAA